MVNPGERGVGILSGHGNISLNNQSSIESLEILSNSLEPFYGKLKEVNTSEDEIPSDITTLLVVGPTELKPIDKFRIDQFIMKGGNVIFSVSGMGPDLNSGRVIPLSPDIIDFIKNYGFVIGSDMLFEPENYIPIRKPAPGNPFLVQTIPYPVWLVSKNDTLNEDHVITQEMAGLFFPWASSLKIDKTRLLPPVPSSEEKPGQKGKILVLSKTTSDSWSEVKAETIFLAPQMLAGSLQNKVTDGSKNKGTFNMAGYAEGRFRSYYAERRPLPPKVSRRYLKESEKPARIVTITSSYFMTSQLLQLAQQMNLSNVSFVLSALDVMNGLEELVGSRSKDVSDPALPNISTAEKNIWTTLNFLLPLLLIVGLGFFQLWKRKKISQKVYS